MPSLRTGAWVLVWILAAQLICAPGDSRAQTWQEGVEVTSLGRFGSWPEEPGSQDNRKYEDDLIGRVWPDAVERTVNNQAYKILFDARTDGVTPGTPSVSVWARNWSFKQIYVGTYPDGYRISYSSMSPGFLVTSMEEGFNLQPEGGFARCAYVSGGQVLVRDLASLMPRDSVFYRHIGTSTWDENWMLVWAPDNSQLGVQVPLLLAFTHHPEFIRYQDGGLYIDFEKGNGETSLVFCVFLDGIGHRSLNEVALWPLGMPPAVANKCRDLVSSLLPYPRRCTEEFSIDNTAGTVTIRNNFSYVPWDDYWETEVTGMAPLPPVAAYAKSQGYPVTCATDPADLGVPTKLGPYQGWRGATTTEYTVPLAPLWSPNLVAPVEPTVWTERARSQVELSTSRNVWDLHDGEGFPQAVAVGNSEALLACPPETREFFLHRSRNALDQKILDFTSDSSPWKQRDVPYTTLYYWYQLTSITHPNLPTDQDCGSGAPLEFIYNYALHSGDWAYVESKWPDIQKIYKYLSISGDWAWMASTCREFGGMGAAIDMFPSQFMGYLSYAKMARVMAARLSGDDADDAAADADKALYLASKGMIPLTQRLGYGDHYASQYYQFAEHDVATGFGEYEYSTRLSPYSDLIPMTSLASVYESLISGEVFHPVIDHVYNRWVPQDFYNVMEERYVAQGSNGYVINDAIYPFNKLNAYFSVGLPQAETIFEQFHMSGGVYEPFFGPWAILHRERYKAAYVYALQDALEAPFWALGSWEPGTVSNAAFDPATGGLGFTLTNNDAFQSSVNVTVLARENPGSVMVDGVPAAFTYDDAWQVLSFTVTGTGAHEVEVLRVGNFAPPGTLSASLRAQSRQVTGNLVFNPGFEECGTHPNWIQPWSTADEDYHDYPQVDTATVHTGAQSAKLHRSSPSYRSSFEQNIFTDLCSSYTIRFWYNIPQAIDSGRLPYVYLEERDGGNPAFPDTFWVHPQYGNPSNGWRMVEIQRTPSQENMQILTLRIGLDGYAAGDGDVVYIDDVEVTADRFDWGRDVAQIPAPAKPSMDGAAPLRCRPVGPGAGFDISYGLPAAAAVDLEIFDTSGRRVRRMASGLAEAGSHVVRWDARNEGGVACASGVYFVRLEAGDRSERERIVLVK